MVARISHLYNQVKCSLGESSLDFFLFDLVYLAHLCTYQTYNFASKNENSLCLPLSSAIDIRSRFIIQMETVEIVITAQSTIEVRIDINEKVLDGTLSVHHQAI